jgi:hypothetical protein
MFTAPFVVAIFSPEQVQQYFDHAIKSVPEWWQKSYIAITGGIWGISSLKNVVPAVIAGVKRAIKK